MTIGNSCNMQAAYVELLSPNNTPSPVDGGSGRMLSWSGGLDFDSFDVYTGFDEGDVIAGIGGTFKGNQTGASHTTMMPGSGVMFWRIANVGQGTRIEGDTWETTVLELVGFKGPANARGGVNEGDGAGVANLGLTDCPDLSVLARGLDASSRGVGASTASLVSGASTAGRAVGSQGANADGASTAGGSAGAGTEVEASGDHGGRAVGNDTTTETEDC